MMRAVIFDLDDTLYSCIPLDKKAKENVARFTCAELAISKEQYQEAYQFGRRETKKRLANVGSGHNRLLYCQKTLEYLGIPPMPLSLRMYEEYWGTFFREMELFPGVRELLRYLREMEIPVMICTDLTAQIQHRKIEALGIAGEIRYLVSSEEAGKEKPSKEIFDLCLEKLNLPPGEIWYVGDNFVRDVQGALQAGMNAVWFHPEAGTEEGAGQEEPHSAALEEGCYRVVSDYRELKKVLMAQI